MVSLELILDASGMQRGAREATAALDSVTQKATTAEQASRKAGVALSAAFQTTGGLNQIASGIASSAKSFADLGIAAGSFGASRTILELAKTVDDFGRLKASVTGVGGAFATVGALMKAHPLLTVATLLSAAASAMSLFSGETKVAANSWDELGKNMAKAQLDERTAAYLGVSTGGARGQQLQQVFAATSNALGGAGGTVGEVSASTGIGKVDLIRYLANQGNANAREYMQTGAVQRTGGGGSLGGVGQETDLSGYRISSQQLQEILRGRYNELSATGPSASESSSYYQFGANNSLLRNQNLLENQPYARKNADNMVEQSKAERSTQEWETYSAKTAENMRKAAQYSEQIGSNFGTSLYDVIAGVNTLRGALSALIGGTARQGLSSAGSALFSAVGRSLAQRGADGNGGTDITGGGSFDVPNAPS